MTYRIEGLAPEPFAPLFELSDAELAERGARRVTADSKPGFPCRVSLADAEPGEEVVLLNYASHDVAGPFRTTYGIYVRKDAVPSPAYVDETPAYLERRTLGLRGFDAEGMLRAGLLAMPGEADARIRELLGRPEIDSIHAHNAAYDDGRPLRHRRAHHRHLLPPVLRRAPPEARECPLLRDRRGGAGRRPPAVPALPARRGDARGGGAGTRLRLARRGRGDAVAR
jgi:hypothetical protein